MKIESCVHENEITSSSKTISTHCAAVCLGTARCSTRWMDDIGKAPKNKMQLWGPHKSTSSISKIGTLTWQTRSCSQSVT